MRNPRALSRVVVFIFLFLPGFLAPAAAQENKLRVIFTEWFPYTYMEEGRAAGFEIEILSQVAQAMNLEVEFTQHPWKRCLLALRSGEADALVSLLKTPEREEYALFPEEHISISRTVFFTKADKQIEFNGDYDQLQGLSIGVIAGFSYGEAFDKSTGLRKEEVVDAGLLIKKVLTGRNDLGAENQAVITGLARRMGAARQLRVLEPPIHAQKLYVGFARANNLQALSERFSLALAKFKKTAAYGAILAKYGVDFPGMAE